MQMVCFMSMKKRDHKKIKTKLIISFVAIIVSIPFIPSSTTYYNKKEAAITPVEEPDLRTLVAEQLGKTFSTHDVKIALAVLKQESSLNPEAKNYNCFYVGDTVYNTRVKGARSRSCESGHEKYAHSVDCGLSQVNFEGKKSCPAYALDADWSINKMIEMHTDRGFEPWVAYTSGAYLTYMK